MTQIDSEIRNSETMEALCAFGVVDGPVPEWAHHLDRLKTIEKETRPETSAHAASTALKAKTLALLVGVGEIEAERLRVALLWHDIGKIDIPAEILGVRGQLSPEQRVVIETHARVGADLLAQCSSMPALFLDIARLHHERYDGEGYERLRGESIPFPARIAQIADFYDALTEKRPYRPRDIPPAEALTIMLKERDGGGRGQDPYLMRVFTTHVLETELRDAPEESVRHLRNYARSDPQDDLRYLGKEAGVMIRPNGERTVFTVDADGQARVDRKVGANGDVIDRITPEQVLTAGTRSHGF